MSKVILDSPENAQTGVSPGGPLVWNAVEGWDRYRLEVTERDPLLDVGEEFEENEVLINRFITDVEPVDGKISFVADPPLSNQTEYVWRVRAARIDIPEPDPVVLGVTVSPSAVQIEEGATADVAANVQVEGDASQEVTWGISDTDVATIQSTGPTTATVTGVLAGNETITATSIADPTKTGTALLSVTEVPVHEGGTQGDIDFLKAMYNRCGGGSWEPAIQAGWVDFMAGNDLPQSDGTQLGGITTAMRNGEMRIVEVRMNTLTENSIQGQDGGGLINAEEVGGQWQLIPGREFPDVGNLTECERFDIKGNTLRGPFPPGKWKMTKCKKILFAGHPRDPEPVGMQHPRSGSGAGKQVRDENYFEGPLTNDGLINMTQLEVFEAMYQGFTGGLPKDFGNIPIVMLLIKGDEDFEGGNGGFTGQIPPEWDNSTTLRYIFLSNGSLTGPLPSILSQDTSRYSDHLFTGGVQESWGDVTGWRMVYVPDNPTLGGTFPDFIFTGEPVGDTTKNRQLNTFHVSNCGIEGEVIQNVDPAKFTHLGVLRLQRNKLNGLIPQWFAGGVSGGRIRLVQFDISAQTGTGMHGPLHADFHNPNAGIWNRVRTWRANGNPIGGPLPEGGWGPDILEARLGDCQFTGKIPEAWGPQTTSSRNFDIQLQRNNLTSYEIGADGHGCIKPVVLSGGNYVTGWRGLQKFRAHDNNLPAEDVGNILKDAAVNVASRIGTAWQRIGSPGSGVGIISVQGNAVPPAWALEHITYLESQGWTVTRDS